MRIQRGYKYIQIKRGYANTDTYIYTERVCKCRGGTVGALIMHCSKNIEMQRNNRNSVSQMAD